LPDDYGVVLNCYSNATTALLHYFQVDVNQDGQLSLSELTDAMKECNDLDAAILGKANAKGTFPMQSMISHKQHAQKGSSCYVVGQSKINIEHIRASGCAELALHYLQAMSLCWQAGPHTC
jgi:hypothetical protein